MSEQETSRSKEVIVPDSAVDQSLNHPSLVEKEEVKEVAPEHIEELEDTTA